MREIAIIGPGSASLYRLTNGGAACIRSIRGLAQSGFVALFLSFFAPSDCFGSQVTLTWADSAGDETGFVVERSSDGVNFSQVATTGANVTTYVDQGLQPSTQYWYTVYATNSSGSSDASNVAQVTTITSADPAVSNPGTISGTLGSAFSYSIVATQSPNSFTVSGNLPTGLSLDPNTGVISGTPQATGEFDVTIGATNSAGTGTSPLVIDISAQQSAAPSGGSGSSVGGAGSVGTGLIPAISSSGTISGDLDQPFSYAIVASGSPNSFSLSGNLPAGLSFDPSSGIISGLPTAAGSFDVTIGASNTFGAGSETLAIDIAGSSSLSAVVNSAMAGSESRLVNLSARAVCGSGDENLVVGFVVTGAPKAVLTRGVGPALSGFGVADALDDPELDLYAGNTSIGSDSGWGGGAALTAAFLQAGAFSLPSGSQDAALLTTLSPGSYSAVVSSPDGEVGVALGEIYDEDSSEVPLGKLSNFSARAQVGLSSNVLVAGFVIEGDSPKQVLIRAVGPSLAQFGVTGVLAQPQINLFQGTTVVQHNDGWGGSQALAAAFAQVGAFALSSPQDSAMLVTLNPGAYTAEISGADGGTGVALVEIYDML